MCLRQLPRWLLPAFSRLKALAASLAKAWFDGGELSLG